MNVDVNFFETLYSFHYEILKVLSHHLQECLLCCSLQQQQQQGVAGRCKVPSGRWCGVGHTPMPPGLTIAAAIRPWQEEWRPPAESVRVGEWVRPNGR